MKGKDQIEEEDAPYISTLALPNSTASPPSIDILESDEDGCQESYVRADEEDDVKDEDDGRRRVRPEFGASVPAVAQGRVANAVRELNLSTGKNGAIMKSSV